MRKPKWKSSKQAGNELECIIAKWLEEAGIPYTQEKTMSEIGRRTAGKVDFVLKNPEGYLECKRYTDRITLKLNSQQHDIKWSQICLLSKAGKKTPLTGFLFQETKDLNIYFMHIDAFIDFWSSSKKSSLNLNDIKENADLITDFKWI